MSASTKRNPFCGDTQKARVCSIAYEFIKEGRYFSNDDVYRRYCEKYHAVTDTMQKTGNVMSKSDIISYKVLGEAVRDIRNLIKNKLGNGAIEERGSTRTKEFRYVGLEYAPDPLCDLEYASKKKHLADYLEFCNDSDGFFPMAWLEYYFQNTQELWEIRKRRQNGERKIFTSAERKVENIEILPRLYTYIKKRQVISFTYRSNYEEDEKLTFHPHILKEFNGGWHLFGYAYPQRQDRPLCRDIVIDRILLDTLEKVTRDVCRYEPMEDTDYYERLFRYRIGTSQKQGEKPAVTNVIIRAHSRYMFSLLKNKPLIHHQKVHVDWGMDGEYGDFLLQVEVNNEFIGRILQMGDMLEVISPEDIREDFRVRISNMNSRYTER